MKLEIRKASDDLIIGAGFAVAMTTALVAGMAIGSLYRRGELKALREMNRELFHESERKTWYLGKQFAEYIKKTHP